MFQVICMEAGRRTGLVQRDVVDRGEDGVHA